MTKFPIPEGVFMNWNVSRTKYKPISSELYEILTKHEAWINGELNGKKADLSYFNLSSVKLSQAILSRANLKYANLSDAIMYNIKLRYANLFSANLTTAHL